MPGRPFPGHRTHYAPSRTTAVPVRLMIRDLLFVLEKLTSLMDENRLAMLARQHGIRQKQDDGGIAKTFAAFLRRADEGSLPRLLVETVILMAVLTDECGNRAPGCRQHLQGALKTGLRGRLRVRTERTTEGTKQIPCRKYTLNERK